jgi:hypothetical protein
LPREICPPHVLYVRTFRVLVAASACEFAWHSKQLGRQADRVSKR